MIQRNARLKRYTPLRKVSKQQYKRINQYKPAKKDFLEDNPECMVKRPGCRFHATQVHHGKGKTGYLLFAKDYFIAVCDGPCHTWVEEHPEEAKLLSLSFKRNK